jgi:hypothetical protein
MSYSFKVKVQLPSGKHIRVEELKNKDYLTILKYCENTDTEGLNDLFNDLIFKGDLKSLDIIDKFYVLLIVRMIFIDPDLIFADVNNNNIKFSISNILEKIDHFQNDYNKTINVQDFTIELGLPNLIYFNDVNDIYISTIKSIRLKDKLINFAELDNTEKELILSYLPNTLFTHINNYITQVSKQLQDFVIVEQNQQFNIAEINTNIISNGFMSFILNIFSTGLKSFLEMLYIFANKINIGGVTYYELSPLDSKVLINIYNKDISDQNKALQNKERE